MNNQAGCKEERCVDEDQGIGSVEPSCCCWEVGASYEAAPDEDNAERVGENLAGEPGSDG